jgi:sugar-specific transcriptional regulator TrmB
VEKDKTCCADRELYNDEYEFMVKQCAEHDLPFDLRNRHIDHAVILTKHILKNSRKKVFFLTGRLHQEFCASIRAELEEALANGCRVEIIFVENGDMPPEIAALQKAHPGRLVLHRINAEMREKAREMGHFCVSDGCRYRIERNHPFDQDFSKDKAVSAVANFNCPDIAGQLVAFFEDTLKHCEKVAA